MRISKLVLASVLCLGLFLPSAVLGAQGDTQQSEVNLARSAGQNFISTHSPSGNSIDWDGAYLTDAQPYYNLEGELIA